MENLTAEINVEFYARYQFYHFWMIVSSVPTILFLAVGGVTLSTAWIDDNRNGKIAGLIFMGICVISTCAFLYNTYQIHVVLKPEIARYIVPAGLDISAKINAEISEMWGILKTLLNK